MGIFCRNYNWMMLTYYMFRIQRKRIKLFAISARLRTLNEYLRWKKTPATMEMLVVAYKERSDVVTSMILLLEKSGRHMDRLKSVHREGK